MSFFKLIAQIPVDLDDIYYAATRPFRMSAGAVLGRIRWIFFRNSLVRCQGCGGVAQWDYLPAGASGHWCDKCVPRGCSYDDIDDDEAGADVVEAEAHGRSIVTGETEIMEPARRRKQNERLLPCEEYWHKPWGWPRKPPGHAYKPSVADRFLHRYCEEKMEYYAAKRKRLFNSDSIDR